MPHSDLSPLINASLSPSQIALAADIGALQIALQEKVKQLFSDLPDLLLSSDDIGGLLALGVSERATLEAELATLEALGIIESDKDTQRPLATQAETLYRLVRTVPQRLRLLALECRLGDGGSRFQFSCDGRLLRSIARIDRLDAIAGDGNQRDEIQRHVKAIRDGIESGTQVPNSVLVVFSEANTSICPEDEDSLPESTIVIRALQDWQVVETPEALGSLAQEQRLVEIDIPFRAAAFDFEKQAMLVDGQQRTAALSLASVERVPYFVLSVNAMISGDEEAKEIFQISNSTVKITAEFSRALVASMTTTPGFLKAEQMVAKAVKRLSLDDPGSPFNGLINYPGTKSTPKPPVAYNSLFKVVETFKTGSLDFKDDVELAEVVKRAFQIVKDAWPNSWGKKPEKSKLMHGMGLRGLSSLISNKLEKHVEVSGASILDEQVWTEIKASISRLQPQLIWSLEELDSATATAKKAYQDEISRRQNTNQDIGAFTSYLKRTSLALDSAANKKKQSK